MSGLLVPFRIAVLIAVSAMSRSGSAAAETEEELSRARGLFQEALSLEVAGDYASALTKLQLVSKVRLTPQVRYHLARCKENLGRLTEALGDYRVAATEARAADLAELDEFERAREAIEARVPKLAIKLAVSSAATIVELDGIQVGATALAAPIPVDPGTRRIVLREAERIILSRMVTAVEGKTLEVMLEEGKSVPSAASPGTKEIPQKSSVPTWAYVAGSVGVVGVASSVAFWAMRGAAMSDLEDACTDGVCPENMRDTYERGRFAAWAAPVTGVVGAVGIGFAVWGFWPKTTNRRRDGGGLRVTMDASSQFAGVRLSSGF